MFHDAPTERGLIQDRTAIHVAVSDILNSAGTSIIMTMDQTSGVVFNNTLSAVGNLTALIYIYTNTEVGSALAGK